MYEALLLVTQVLVLGVLACGVFEYLRLRQRIVMAVTVLREKMDCDELIDQLLEQRDAPVIPSSESTRCAVPTTNGAAMPGTASKRDRLAALAAGGQVRQYLGVAAQRLTTDQIDSMGDEEIEKLYARYEARLGAAMTKTLGQAALQLYSGVASMLLPIPLESRPKLVADLEADPFVGHALSSACCELYHRYGMYLAPLTAAFTTAKYCQFEHPSPRTIGSDNVGRGCRDSSGESDSGGATGTADDS